MEKKYYGDDMMDKKVTPIQVNGLEIGGDKIIKIAGPCSVESRDQIINTAIELKKAGVDILRGGAFKPRTSPFDFQGLGEEGLKLLREAGDLIGVPVVTELMDAASLDMVYQYTDIIQIGSRNMHNYALLKAVGETDKPILLKRGMSATIKEWIMATEYIKMGGNESIILCERGIRTFDTYTRNTLDLAAVPIMQGETGFPVIVDPSHGTGIKALMKPMSMAAVACGAKGIMLEVHIEPEKALCDGEQSLTPEEYASIVRDLKTIK